MTQGLITLNGASAGYARGAVLHNINLTIAPGERIAIMGRSGAGKSTLLNLIYDKLGSDVALIPQAASLVKALSVFHNVFMGRLDRYPVLHNLRNLIWPHRRDVSDVTEILQLVELDDKLFAKAGELSGGQQQRTSVARALYNGRRIVIGDEPVSALDRVQASAVLKVLHERSDTTIVALHDIQLALTHSERIIVLDEGRIVLDSPASALTASDLVPYYGG